MEKFETLIIVIKSILKTSNNFKKNYMVNIDCDLIKSTDTPKILDLAFDGKHT